MLKKFQKGYSVEEISNILEENCEVIRKIVNELNSKYMILRAYIADKELVIHGSFICFLCEKIFHKLRSCF